MEKIDILVCDSAAYNKKLYKTIKEGINPKGGLMRCWTHLLDLVSDCWQDSELNGNLHTITAKFQHLLNRSSLRKTRYIQFLKDKGCPNPKSMPTMVLTRWNSWYQIICYLAEFLPHIKAFAVAEKPKENSELVNCLLEILEDPYKYSEIKLLVQFYFENAQVCSDMIQYFETPKGITHQSYNKITNLWNFLRFNVYNDDFGESIHQIINQNDMDLSFWTSAFKNLYRKAFIKLDQGARTLGIFKGSQGFLS